MSSSLIPYFTGEQNLKRLAGFDCLHGELLASDSLDAKPPARGSPGAVVCRIENVVRSG